MKTLQQHIEDAFAHHRAGDLDKAESIYDQLICQLEKPDPNILFGYGTLLVCRQKFGLGIGLLQAAVLALPECAPILTNLACAYKQIGKDELSLKAYEKALSLEPNGADILAGFAGFWINKNEAKKVIDYSQRAIAVDQTHDAAHMHLALGLLEQGKFSEAWPHYEHRWETPERIKDKRPYKAPRWNGEKVKTLAIHGEQGLGDEILFMSLLSKARPFAENIIIECADRLVDIFKDSFGLRCYKDHQSLIAAEGEPDAYSPMASLPTVLGLPDGKPFLKRHRTRQNKRPVIGIAWHGGTPKTSVSDRTLKLSDFAPILEIPGIEFIPVQYGEHLERELDIFGLPNPPTDFNSIHQRITDCDLVVTVCQTAVHQAGAMGVDCWVLTPIRAAWRYCGEDMRPWYNSVKFFRQEVAGKWELPIQMVAASLKERYALLAA